MVQRLLARVLAVGVSAAAATAGPAATAQEGDPARGEAGLEVWGACHVVDQEN